MMTFTYRPIYPGKKVCVARTSARIWQRFGDTELKPSDHLDSSIVVVCFD